MMIVVRRTRFSLKGVSLGVLTIVGDLNLDGPGRQLTVGDMSFVGSHVHFALHERITIGSRVSINDGCVFLTATHRTKDVRFGTRKETITVDEYAWIAMNSIILPRVHIGKGAVVGAGSVVSKSVPEFTVVAGNPAVRVGERSRNLCYSPVEWVAAFEAWLGKPELRVDTPQFRDIPIANTPSETQ